MINFCIKKFHRNDPLATVLTLIVHTNFREKLIFVATIDYENIFTTKISRFTVLEKKDDITLT